MLSHVGIYVVKYVCTCRVHEIQQRVITHINDFGSQSYALGSICSKPKAENEPKPESRIYLIEE